MGIVRKTLAGQDLVKKKTNLERKVSNDESGNVWSLLQFQSQIPGGG